MWTSESCLPGGDTDASKGGVERRSRGHAPFEKLLGEARREAGLKTGRGEGAEPRVTKSRQGGFGWVRELGVWLKDRRRVGWLVFPFVDGQRKLVEKARESWSRRPEKVGREEVLRSEHGERPIQRRHGRETRQRRSCGGPARPDEKCRRGFAGRERSRGQAGPR